MSERRVPTHIIKEAGSSRSLLKVIADGIGYGAMGQRVSASGARVTTLGRA